MKFNTQKDLLDYTRNIVGKTFGEIDSEGLLDKTRLNKNKGVLGHVVETGFYKYPLNSDSKADFEQLGIELKVTAYVRNKNGILRAKERLVLSKIDFNQIINETFETSHVLGKCHKMLIIWYEYDKLKEPRDFLITHYQLYDMNQDRKIFENDFQIIKNKVLDGKAHELSEGDTSYLGACTKARLSTDRTKQPFSDILPKPRAFSLKNGYLTGILRELIENINLTLSDSQQSTLDSLATDDSHNIEDILSDSDLDTLDDLPPRDIGGFDDVLLDSELDDSILFDSELNSLDDSPISSDENDSTDNLPVSDVNGSKTIEFNSSKYSDDYKTVLEYVHDKLQPYFGKTQVQIYNEVIGAVNREKIPKNIGKLISDKLIGKDSELPDKHPLFKKTNFIIKNLPITKNNKPRERMSFKTISLSEFEDEWLDSYWRNFFEETTIIVICYQEQNQSKNGFRILKDVRKLSFDDDDFDAFQITYNQIKLAIEERDINLLPTSTNGFKNLELQIAPKGVKGDNAYENFFAMDKTKVTFMLSKDLLHRKLDF